MSINPSRREGGGGGVEKTPTHNVGPILKNMRHFPKKVKRLLGRDFSHPFLKSRSPARRWHPVCCRIRAGVCAGPQSPVVAPALQGTGVGAGVWVWVWDELVLLKGEDYPYGLKSQRETCDWPLAIGSLEEK